MVVTPMAVVEITLSRTCGAVILVFCLALPIRLFRLIRREPRLRTAVKINVHDLCGHGGLPFAGCCDGNGAAVRFIGS
jgi:hypothetical protein